MTPLWEGTDESRPERPIPAHRDTCLVMRQTAGSLPEPFDSGLPFGVRRHPSPLSVAIEEPLCVKAIESGEVCPCASGSFPARRETPRATAFSRPPGARGHLSAEDRLGWLGVLARSVRWLCRPRVRTSFLPAKAVSPSRFHRDSATALQRLSRLRGSRRVRPRLSRRAGIGPFGPATA